MMNGPFGVQEAGFRTRFELLVKSWWSPRISIDRTFRGPLWSAGMRRRFLAGALVFYAALMAALVFGPQVLAKREAAPPTSCTGTLAHASTLDITVPTGAVCRVTASIVRGSVNVQRDAY